MRTIVVTGYKPMEMGIFKQNDPKIAFIKETIRRRLISMIEEGLEWILISGQMGIELWTGEVVLDLKEAYDINLGVIPPFTNQQERWPEDIQMVYEEVTMIADFHKPVYEKSYDGPYQFQAKDQFLVEHSDGCLVLFDEETTGSPEYFLRHARKSEEMGKYKILYITPLDLEETVEELRMSDPDYWSQQ
ncbi:SLOG family protein [Halobacillus mangrovi]|uniref:SLOG family protein n=1 Tax=Halobacillus mangrovi TaxID=402384 RepID=UPI003D9645C3